MVLHDFICKPCGITFEAVSSYSDASRSVENVACERCGQPCGIVWLKSPGMAGDENLTAEEKVAVALKLGMRPDGKLVVPQTRTDIRKIRSAIGDIPVGKNEVTRRDRRTADTRSTSERESAKAETIDFIRRRRSMHRAGEIPRAIADSETSKAMKNQPLSEKRVLARNGAQK